MSLALINKEKRNKPFRMGDIAIYMIIVCLIAVLFLVFIFRDKSSVLKGIEIISDENTVLEYYFDDDKFIYMTNDGFILTETYSGYEITVYADKGKTEYNIIVIDRQKRIISLKDANCSIGKDCVSMVIDADDDVIVCVPHRLKIKSLSKGIESPVSG